MKKIYNNPRMDIIKIKTCGVIANSNPSVSMDSTETPIEAGSIESRGFSGFGDDDE
jgi:hypothetical protein